MTLKRIYKNYYICNERIFKMNKKVISIIFVISILISSMAIPASAANYATETMYASINGGATVSSQTGPEKCHEEFSVL
jgi:hypothetical protein